MKITILLIDKLLRLKNGEKLPASSLSGAWVEGALRDGILVSRSQGARRTLFAPNGVNLETFLSQIDERLGNLEKMRQVLCEEASRYEQAAGTGNSKLKMIRSCPGFLVNSYEPVRCRLNGEDFVVNPSEGSFVFVADWQTFVPQHDAIIVGVENMENFRLIRKQRSFFEKEIGASRPLLFVSRYPQSLDLRNWLVGIENKYVHFGDFDLAGINIFQTEFWPFLKERSSFLISSDIEKRLQRGSPERYNDQYQRFKKLSSANADIQELIDLIHKYHRCYDQEGYIG